MKQFWSVRELAEKADVSTRWIHYEIERNKFPGCQKIGNSFAIPHEDAIAWLKDRGVEVEEEAK